MAILTKIRVYIAAFILGLVASGITAFPLLYELNFLCWLIEGNVGNPLPSSGLKWWIFHVREGLLATNQHYPFLAYGTDWLAFGHLVIALFFIGPLIDPIKNIWVIHAGLIACVSVPLLAFICGPIREIPIYWRLIDSSFGIIGFIPLWLTLTLTKQLEMGSAAKS